MSAPEQLGPYRIEGELGRGGMGVVYRAVHTELARPVALKVLSAGAESSSPEIIARFHREAQSAAKLADHPGIVGVHDAGRDGDTCWLAMDLIDGQSLDHLLDEEAIAIDQAIRIGAECADALAHAHAAGVLHRDVKPANILLAADGAARLTDFGLARPLDAGPDVQKLTRTGVVVGTPSYMPPEQLRGGPVDARADVYALGATIYELVSGHAPFSGGSMHTLIGQVLRQEARPLKLGPPGLAAVVARCLDKSPDRRYPSAAALAADLRRLERGESVSVQLPGPVTRSWRRVRNRPLTAIAVTGVLSALGGVAVTAAVLRENEGTAQDSLRDEANQRKAVDRSTAQATAYQDALQSAGAQLRRCAEHGRGATLSDADLNDALAGLAITAQAVAGRHPLAESPRGLVPLGRALAGDVPAFAELEGLAEQGDDPFLHLWLAQALLARYAHALRMPAITVGDRVRVFQFDEPESVRALLERAGQALQQVRASAGWTALRSGEALKQWATGADALATNDPAGALQALLPLADDPLLGDNARLLIAIARYLQAEYHEAAETWERLSNGRSARLLERAALARLSAATVAAVRGDDPRAALTAAGAHFDAVLAADPQRVTALRSRHITFRFLADQASDRGADATAHLAAARRDADAIVRADPRNALGYRLRGGTSLAEATAQQRAGRPAGEALNAALVALREAQRMAPDDGDVMLELGQTLRRQGEAATDAGADARAVLEQAVQLQEQALERLGARTKTTHSLAMARLALGRARADAGQDPREQYRLAVEEFDVVVATDPAYHSALVNRARAHRGLGVEAAERGQDAAPHLKAAVADCTEALRRARHSTASLVNRSTAYRELGEAAIADSAQAGSWFQLAADDLTAALERRPKDPRLLHNRGLVWDRLGRTRRDTAPAEAERVFMRAVADFNAALEAAPAMWRVKLDGAQTVQAIAGLKAAGGEGFLPWYDAAITQCTQLLDAGHRVPEVYVARAQAWRMRGAWLTRADHDPAASYAAALTDCADALKSDPQHWRAYAVRGLIHEQQDRWADAAAAYTAGLTLVPGHGWLLSLQREALQRAEKR